MDPLSSYCKIISTLRSSITPPASVSAPLASLPPPAFPLQWVGSFFNLLTSWIHFCPSLFYCLLLGFLCSDWIGFFRVAQCFFYFLDI